MRIREIGDENSFVPYDLPPQWVFSGSLWPLLAEANKQIGILQGIGWNLPNPGILLRPLSNREAIKSSQLEGTYVTSEQLLLFEIDPKESGSDAAINDRREVLNYRRALEQGINSDLPLSLRLLRELHRTLLAGVRGRDRFPGDFRRVPVAIGSNHRFVPPPWENVGGLLDSLEKYLHAPSGEYNPLVHCFLVHYQFETIHPFVDGNGRIGRLLLALMLKQSCDLSKPWLFLSEFYERHRDEYIQRLFDVSAKGDWHGWIEFCLRGTLDQAKATIKRCKRLLTIRKEFEERLAKIKGSNRLNQVVEMLFYSPFVRIADLKRRLRVSYPTARSDVDRLVEIEILEKLPTVTPKTFYAPEVFNVAYEETG